MNNSIYPLKFRAYEANIGKKPESHTQAVCDARDYFDTFNPIPKEHKVGIAPDRYGDWRFVTSVPSKNDPNGQAFDAAKQSSDFIDVTDDYHKLMGH
jgi:hypothetical protein